MLLNFTQKMGILDFLSTSGNWRNLFDLEFFTQRDIRLGRNFTIRDACIFENDLGTKSVIEHKPTGAKLYFERLPFGAVSYRDETGHEGIVSAFGASTEEGVLTHLRATQGALLYDVPYMDVCVLFTPEGEKRIYCEDLNTEITLPPPLEKPKTPLQVSQYFHAISLNSETAQSFNLPVYNLLDAAKLVLSRDLNIDPDLKAINVLDENAMENAGTEFLKDRWDAGWQGPWQWRPKLKNKLPELEKLQKTWNDSTQFESGGSIAASQAFVMQREDDGFKLRTSLNSREAIWVQGTVARMAIYNATPVTAIHDRAGPQTLLHLMRAGKTVRDHRGGEWKAALIHHKYAFIVANNMRKSAREQFALQGGEYVALHHAQGEAVIAIRIEDLESAAEKLAASRGVEPQSPSASVTRLRPAH